ncbi:uncharacterized protein LOC120079117 [Benincasa hispida]|uniref:uncharacterized protein LOC120079117 n=1 Tax=Benincasa hispida TaxID=102211 RepID=UPI001900CA2A|nr:uncharacterized protein LOC120079117 [Benincasa hispida]
MSIRPEIILRNHPSHPWHVLELKNYMEPYTCDGCKEKGFGPRYRCEKCDFDLHQACTYNRIASVSHDYFPGSKFRFLRNPPKPCHPECIIRCDACRKTIKGFVFHCEEDNLDLHPCCRNLKRSYEIEDVKFNLHKKVRGKCMWCNRKSLKDGGNDNGWSYMSECGNYHVHVACITEMALEEWYNYNNNNKQQRGGTSSSSGGSMRAMKSTTTTTTAPQSLAVKLKVQEIQARRRGDGGGKDKFWRILKFIIKTVVSIVIGDPTMIVASFFVQLLP